MKVVSNGACLKLIPELSGFEYKFFGMAWAPQNDRMAFVLVGTNDAEAGNKSPVYDADLVPYTGTIYEHSEFNNINGDLLTSDDVYYFKNGHLHNEIGAAAVHITIGPQSKEEKRHNAINGLYEDPRAGEWAYNIYHQFDKGQ